MPKSGYISPSQFKQIMTCDTKGNWPGKTAISLVDEIVIGLLGVESNEIQSDALDHGNAYETEAIEAYELFNFCSVQKQTDTIYHPKYNFICGHVDGLVGTEKVLEIKCPYNPINHYRNIKESAQLTKLYYPQTQGYLWITGRHKLDFVSYSPHFPERLQLHITTVERDEIFIQELEEKCLKFWGIVQTEFDKIRD